MAAGSAKDFIKGTMGSTSGGPIVFIPLLRALETGEGSISGRVRRTNSHYVHWNSTDAELEADVPEQLDPLVDKLQDYLDEMIVDLNKELEKELYAELEYQQSDEAVTDSLNANDRLFDDETGEEIDGSDYFYIDGLPGNVTQKILAQYAEMFERTPEDVFKSLKAKKVHFDKRGNRIDTSHFKTVDQLEPQLKAKVLDKFRHWNTEDNFWAQPTEDSWKERLEKMGFDRVEINYSLGYSQGDGASFTADSIDGLQLLKHLLHREETRQQTRALVAALLI